MEDLDWEEGGRAGLSDDEVFVLTYFADIENQTLRYLRALLSMQGAFEPDMAAFLTTWNYEEFFHGYALERLLAAAGHPLCPERRAQVQRHARLREQLEGVVAPVVSRLWSSAFPAVYLTFGALQELTTLRGYEGLAARSENPLLQVLARRIARQERRHFAFYFNQAKRRLSQSRGAKSLTRALLRWHWTPVGAGVKTRAEVMRLYGILFPGAEGAAVCGDIDRRIGQLPGLRGICPVARYFAEGEGASRGGAVRQGGA